MAGENDATDEVLGALRWLPADRTFENVQRVGEALGLHHETHRT